MKNGKRIVMPLLLMLCVLLAAFPVSAASKYKKEWVTAKNGKVYYYNETGKKVTGMQKIGKRYYYFDEKGAQKTGWIKIKNSYYFFRNKNGVKGSKGYRVESATVNGVQLLANGKAKRNSYSKQKLPLLIQARTLVDKITNDKMTQEQKLKAAFDYAKKNLKASNWGPFKNSAVWDMVYAKRPFDTGRADCYNYGAYFAYLANAIGYKASAVSSGWHGWAEIGNKVYDVNWAWVKKTDVYFGLPYSLSGRNGHPNYKNGRRYVKTI